MMTGLHRTEVAMEAARFDASWSSAQEAERWVLATCTRLGIPDATAFAIQACAEELFTNTVRHGISPSNNESDPSSSAWFELRIGLSGNTVLLEYLDNGVEFDLAKALNTPNDTPAKDLQVGGLGLRLVKGLAASIRYARVGEWNVTNLAFECPSAATLGVASKA